MKDKIKGFYFHIPESHLSWDRYNDWVEDLRICVDEMHEQYKKERQNETRRNDSSNIDKLQGSLS